MDFGYFKSQRDDIMLKMTQMVGETLPKDGSESMQGDLKMTDDSGNQQKISGLAPATDR